MAAAKAITENTLFYGDNLPILRDHLQDESIGVDLIYLDPPFNSNRSYNVLFREEGGLESEAQISAFDDSWHWDKSANRTYYDIIQNAPIRITELIGALHSFIGENQMMAYLVMMTARLVELHRVLKSTGSLYLHCDPTASHYLKVILDAILAKRITVMKLFGSGFLFMQTQIGLEESLIDYYFLPRAKILYSQNKGNHFQMITWEVSLYTQTPMGVYIV